MSNYLKAFGMVVIATVLFNNYDAAKAKPKKPSGGLLMSSSESFPKIGDGSLRTLNNYSPFQKADKEYFKSDQFKFPVAGDAAAEAAVYLTGKPLDTGMDNHFYNYDYANIYGFNTCEAESPQPVSVTCASFNAKISALESGATFTSTSLELNWHDLIVSWIKANKMSSQNYFFLTAGNIATVVTDFSADTDCSSLLTSLFGANYDATILINKYLKWYVKNGIIINYSLLEHADKADANLDDGAVALSLQTLTDSVASLESWKHKQDYLPKNFCFGNYISSYVIKSDQFNFTTDAPGYEAFKTDLWSDQELTDFKTAFYSNSNSDMIMLALNQTGQIFNFNKNTYRSKVMIVDTNLSDLLDLAAKNTNITTLEQLGKNFGYPSVENLIFNKAVIKYNLGSSKYVVSSDLTGSFPGETAELDANFTAFAQKFLKDGTETTVFGDLFSYYMKGEFDTATNKYNYTKFSPSTFMSDNSGKPEGTTYESLLPSSFNLVDFVFRLFYTVTTNPFDFETIQVIADADAEAIATKIMAVTEYSDFLTQVFSLDATSLKSLIINSWINKKEIYSDFAQLEEKSIINYDLLAVQISSKTDITELETACKNAFKAGYRVFRHADFILSVREEVPNKDLIVPVTIQTVETVALKLDKSLALKTILNKCFNSATATDLANRIVKVYVPVSQCSNKKEGETQAAYFASMQELDMIALETKILTMTWAESLTDLNICDFDVNDLLVKYVYMNIDLRTSFAVAQNLKIEKSVFDGFNDSMNLKLYQKAIDNQNIPTITELGNFVRDRYNARSYDLKTQYHVDFKVLAHPIGSNLMNNLVSDFFMCKEMYKISVGFMYSGEFYKGSNDYLVENPECVINSDPATPCPASESNFLANTTINNFGVQELLDLTKSLFSEQKDTSQILNSYPLDNLIADLVLRNKNIDMDKSFSIASLDINKIVNEFKATNIYTQIVDRMPSFADVNFDQCIKYLFYPRIQDKNIIYDFPRKFNYTGLCALPGSSTFFLPSNVVTAKNENPDALLSEILPLNENILQIAKAFYIPSMASHLGKVQKDFADENIVRNELTSIDMVAAYITEFHPALDVEKFIELLSGKVDFLDSREILTVKSVNHFRLIPTEVLSNETSSNMTDPVSQAAFLSQNLTKSYVKSQGFEAGKFYVWDVRQAIASFEIFSLLTSKDQEFVISEFATIVFDSKSESDSKIVPSSFKVLDYLDQVTVFNNDPNTAAPQFPPELKFEDVVRFSIFIISDNLEQVKLDIETEGIFPLNFCEVIANNTLLNKTLIAYDKNCDDVKLYVKALQQNKDVFVDTNYGSDQCIFDSDLIELKASQSHPSRFCEFMNGLNLNLPDIVYTIINQQLKSKPLNERFISNSLVSDLEVKVSAEYPLMNKYASECLKIQISTLVDNYLHLNVFAEPNLDINANAGTIIPIPALRLVPSEADSQIFVINSTNPQEQLALSGNTNATQVEEISAVLVGSLIFIDCNDVEASSPMIEDVLAAYNTAYDGSAVKGFIEQDQVPNFNLTKLVLDYQTRRCAGTNKCLYLFDPQTATKEFQIFHEAKIMPFIGIEAQNSSVDGNITIDGSTNSTDPIDSGNSTNSTDPIDSGNSTNSTDPIDSGNSTNSTDPIDSGNSTNSTDPIDSGNSTNSTDPIDSGNSTNSTDPIDSGNSTNSTDPIDSGNSTNSTDPIDSGNSTNSTDPIDSGNSTNSTDPIDSGNSTNSTDPIDSGNSTNSTDPIDSGNSTNSTDPIDSGNSTNSTDPIDSGNSTNSTDPIDSGNSTNSTDPIDSGNSTNSTDPIDSGNSTNSTDPIDSGNSTNSTDPIDSGNSTNSTDPIDSGNSTNSTDPIDSGNSTNSTDPIDSGNSTNSTDPIDSGNSTNSTDPIDSGNSTNSTDPIDSGNSTNSTDPIDSGNSTNSTDPIDSGNSTNSTDPIDSGNSTNSTDPIDSGNSTNSTDPIDSGNSTNSTDPIDSGNSTNSTDPIDSGNSTNSTDPIDSGNSTNSTDPIDSGNSTNSTDPIDSGNSTNSTDPIDSGNSTNSTDPIDSGNSTNSTDPIDSGNSTNSTDPIDPENSNNSTNVDGDSSEWDNFPEDENFFIEDFETNKEDFVDLSKLLEEESDSDSIIDFGTDSETTEGETIDNSMPSSEEFAFDFKFEGSVVDAIALFNSTTDSNFCENIINFDNIYESLWIPLKDNLTHTLYPNSSVLFVPDVDIEAIVASLSNLKGFSDFVSICHIESDLIESFKNDELSIAFDKTAYSNNLEELVNALNPEVENNDQPLGFALANFIASSLVVITNNSKQITDENGNFVLLSDNSYIAAKAKLLAVIKSKANLNTACTEAEYSKLVDDIMKSHYSSNDLEMTKITIDIDLGANDPIKAFRTKSFCIFDGDYAVISKASQLQVFMNALKQSPALENNFVYTLNNLPIGSNAYAFDYAADSDVISQNFLGGIQAEEVLSYLTEENLLTLFNHNDVKVTQNMIKDINLKNQDHVSNSEDLEALNFTISVSDYLNKLTFFRIECNQSKKLNRLLSAKSDILLSMKMMNSDVYKLVTTYNTEENLFKALSDDYNNKFISKCGDDIKNPEVTAKLDTLKNETLLQLAAFDITDHVKVNKALFDYVMGALGIVLTTDTSKPVYPWDFLATDPEKIIEKIDLYPEISAFLLSNLTVSLEKFHILNIVLSLQIASLAPEPLNITFESLYNQVVSKNATDASLNQTLQSLNLDSLVFGLFSNTVNKENIDKIKEIVDFGFVINKIMENPFSEEIQAKHPFCDPIEYANQYFLLDFDRSQPLPCFDESTNIAQLVYGTCTMNMKALAANICPTLNLTIFIEKGAKEVIEYMLADGVDISQLTTDEILYYLDENSFMKQFLLIAGQDINMSDIIEKYLQQLIANPPQIPSLPSEQDSVPIFVYQRIGEIFPGDTEGSKMYLLTGVKSNFVSKDGSVKVIYNFFYSNSKGVTPLYPSIIMITIHVNDNIYIRQAIDGVEDDSQIIRKPAGFSQADLKDIYNSDLEKVAVMMKNMKPTTSETK
jgi:hypothetical protein